MNNNMLHYIKKSGFVRSVFLRVLSIFIIASIAITAIAFFSFTSEIRKDILEDRQHQLSAIEETISKRMEEISSIAYKISTDSAFYLEPIVDKNSGYEMSETLARYLVGNSFIEHLAYYRLSEPDKIYISSGERSLSEFFTTSFGLDEESAKGFIENIQRQTQTQVRTISYNESDTFFAYLYPLPQLSAKPQAFIMMLIPLNEVTPIFESLLTDMNGEIAAFDSSGKEIYRMGNMGESFPLEDFARNESGDEAVINENNEEYVLQKVVSSSNGWTYVSAIRQSDTLSGVANKQLVFIVLLLLLVIVAIITMLACIIVQYKPISALAETVAGETSGKAIDERILLSNTIATLKDDSEQKQKFENAYYEAEAASKAKSAFLSNMSHDIRTPMNAVIGMTAIALKHADEPDYVRECLKKVQVSSQYLLDIINNVLDMSRIESGRFTMTQETINLPVLIDSFIALIEPSAETKSQKLNVEISNVMQEFVIGDSVRLTQICVNILSNSVKFTPEGGSISLGMHQAESTDEGYGNYIFTFSDTGIGMPPEFIDKVFDTFSRAEDANVSKVEGTGLGMAITKNLVELMGGTIKCESEPEHGTTFTVTLHLKLAGEETQSRNFRRLPAAKQDSVEKVINLSGRRIMLVEDNVINREIATRILAETSAEVVQTVNGKEAVEVFKKSHEGYFDIILMDLQMPVMNGYEATSEIRSLKRSDAQTVPIYAMTANTFDEDVRQVKDAGMNGHIGKPYTPATLYRILAQVLEDR